MNDTKLLGAIKSAARRAVNHRLSGRINEALKVEASVDLFTKTAEDRGLADEAFEAEQEGQEEAR